MKKTSIILSTVLFCGVITSGVYCTNKRTTDSTFAQSQTSSGNKTAINSEVNFVSAAAAVTPAVVHIKSSYRTQSRSGYPFGYRQSIPAIGSGSGVIIASDGYIATNNHVVENAAKVEVELPDRRSFAAQMVGRDPNTDLALLKVNASGLPVAKLANSDNVQVREWVLAIGYPFSLNTTVTAGIVSAKGRSIEIIQSSERGDAQQASTVIESFIQTDAAINPGNSGGALINTSGELIGINTAIASLTGSYAGYAFAIPVNLAKKILDDLRKFGTVKRGILGVSFPAPSAEDQYLKQQGINPGSVKGVIITDIQSGSAAAAAGLREGDIIQSIDGSELSSSAEFSERIARHRPSDKITLTYLRDGKVRSASATLKGEEVLKPLADNDKSLREIYNKLGATFSPLTPALKQHFNLEAGVVVTEVRAGGFFDQLGIPPGTIIAYINGKELYSPKDIQDALMAAQNNRIQILAIAPDGSRVAFNFSFGA